MTLTPTNRTYTNAETGEECKIYTSADASRLHLINEATGKTIAIVYTTHSDAKLLSYAPQMLQALKNADTPEHKRLADDIESEMYESRIDWNKIDDLGTKLNKW